MIGKRIRLEAEEKTMISRYLSRSVLSQQTISLTVIEGDFGALNE
jgi:hypothetical protein